MKTIIEITGQVNSVSSIYRAMPNNGLERVKEIRYGCKELTYSSEEFAIAAMRTAWERIEAEDDSLSISDGISSNGIRLDYDSGTAKIYNPKI